MFKQFSKGNRIHKTIDSTLITLPAPINISVIWNIGSLLGLCLITQIISGLILAVSYTPSITIRFYDTFKIIETHDIAWILRYLHSNGASIFFVSLYIHTARGMYYSSFTQKHTWIIGVRILLLTIATAFIGYVLPLNQMSYWGARVITNLFSEVPYIGKNLTQLIWGGPSVFEPTLTRFFAFHFLTPFIIAAIAILHITFLHMHGSQNPLGLSSSNNKLNFSLNFVIKDIIGIILMITIFLTFVIYNPLILGDDENFTVANPSVTPHHIQPEWYFLFAYAILRRVPNKLGGIIALAISILILYTNPFTTTINKKTISFYPLNKIIYWTFIITITLLTWIGARPVEPPYLITGQILTIIYFSYFIANPILFIIWDKTN